MGMININPSTMNQGFSTISDALRGYQQNVMNQARQDALLAQQDVENKRAADKLRLLQEAAGDAQAKQARADFTSAGVSEILAAPTIGERQALLADYSKAGGFTPSAQESALLLRTTTPEKDKKVKYSGNYYSKLLDNGQVQKVKATSEKQAQDLLSQGFQLGSITGGTGRSSGGAGSGRTKDYASKTLEYINKTLTDTDFFMKDAAPAAKEWMNKAKGKGISDREIHQAILAGTEDGDDFNEVAANAYLNRQVPETQEKGPIEQVVSAEEKTEQPTPTRQRTRRRRSRPTPSNKVTEDKALLYDTASEYNQPLLNLQTQINEQGGLLTAQPQLIRKYNQLLGEQKLLAGPENKARQARINDVASKLDANGRQQFQALLPSIPANELDEFLKEWKKPKAQNKYFTYKQ